MPSYALLADIEARYPAELIVLAGDETTGLRDDGRVERALEDASSEIRGILKARYAPAELARLDEDSLETLKIYCIDLALYRIAISFSRSNERIKERYDAAIKRLEAIASGKGGLSFTPGGGGDDGPSAPAGAASPNEVLIDAPVRIFSPRRMRFS
ncbi:DUF1320 domain-containing protein [Methylopila sp. 73B]|uniref:gp436 family protein n=1 Tax=Methylopila sp. 73B TaxID=1120792 RepID=UPI00036BFD8F|nr:DUF1320 domain-containing protein [Methylopila sp. 73B]